jgi:hypothetical protein
MIDVAQIAETARRRGKAGRLQTEHRPGLLTSFPLQAINLSLVVLGALASTLLATARWSDQPPSPGFSREPLSADYSVTINKVGSLPDSAILYEGQTAFWTLFPQAWKDSAEWRLSFPQGIQPLAVYVQGDEIAPQASTIPNDGLFYVIPSLLIAGKTRIVIRGAFAEDPQLKLHWNRSYVSNSSSGSTSRIPWWQDHILASIAISAVYLLAIGLVLAWCINELRFRLKRPAPVVSIGVGLIAIVAASIFTTNFDIQLFKGLGEGYWVNGPLLPLTLNGFGPLNDLLFTVPQLPYVLLANAIGRHSEMALNLAIRIPFIVGWLLLIASAFRLKSSLRQRSASMFPWSILVLNPLILMITLWQPEAMLAALVLLAFVMLFEGRAITAGVVLGIAFSGKYWPAFVGPIMLVAAWRLLGPKKAGAFLIASCGTAVGIMAAYWLPTAIALKSPSDFVNLLMQRMPYFGGSHAAANSTLWSLYALPKRLLDSELAWFVSSVESWSFLFFLVLYVAIIALCLRGEMNQRRALLAAAAVLALVAAINSLSVPQFGLWSLPLALVAGVDRNRRRLFAQLVIAASWCGVAVFFFSEPAAYLLLHVSSAQDAFAYSIAPWFLNHVVSVPLARLFGFMFALLLLVAAACMGAQLLLGKKRLTANP